MRQRADRCGKSVYRRIFTGSVEDNFKNSYELEFDFNNRNVKDDGFTAIPIGGFKRV